MKDVSCPYCKHEQDIDHDDGYGYEEDRTHEQECPNCKKRFAFTASRLYYYDAYKADCLNGGKHNYKPTHTHPVVFTKMICSMCDDEREPTEKEMFKILAAKLKKNPS